MRNYEIIKGILSEKKSIEERLEKFYKDSIRHYEELIIGLISVLKEPVILPKADQEIKKFTDIRVGTILYLGRSNVTSLRIIDTITKQEYEEGIDYKIVHNGSYFEILTNGAIKNSADLTAIISGDSYPLKTYEGFSGLEYMDKPKEETQRAYDKAKIELEFIKNDKKRSIYDYPYLEDVCYFDEKRIGKIVNTLSWLNRDVSGVSIKDMTTIFESLNKMERLTHLIEKMTKFKERYKTKTRDKPIINSLIRLINESSDREFANKLLDELAGYEDDYSKEITGYEVIKDYHNIIDYRLKRLSPKPYQEIVFNRVTFNKDVLIQNKKEYNTLYGSLEDICKKYTNNYENLIKNDAELHKKYQLK